MRDSAHFRKLKISPLIVFSTIIFLISLHDGIMSYVSPVILNSKLQDPFLVGLILSSSSLFGMFFNFIIATFYDHKDYRFFIPRMLFFALLFPTIYLILPRDYIPFVLAMIVWSVYYEFRNYSKYNFVHEFLPPQENTEAWSVMTMFQSASYMIGPAIAVFLTTKNLDAPLYASITIVSTAIFLYIIFLKFYAKDKLKTKKVAKGSFSDVINQLKTFKILFKKLWALITFNFTLALLDVSFWTVGVLYSEKLRQTHDFGALFIIVYGFPAIFVGLVTPHIYQKLGKKRTAFISGILAGLSLVAVGFAQNIFLILGSVFLASAFSGITFILICATFEDYVTRLDGEENDIVSMSQFSINLAYAAGPVILGLIARTYSFGASFITTGVILVLSAILSMLVVPRKIRMPRKELAEVN
ncbi:MFS transporter [Patescibacteria group bacterium]|nr:MFS transporter [Patescibacteria group bacterium]